MSEELKKKLEESIKHLLPKQELDIKKIKALIEAAPFISIDLIKEKVKDKALAEKMYEEYKKQLPEFYVIIYKDIPIQCGWSDSLDKEQTQYYCEKLSKPFLLSKNKIFFSLINRTNQNAALIEQQLTTLSKSVENNLL